MPLRLRKASRSIELKVFILFLKQRFFLTAEKLRSFKTWKRFFAQTLRFISVFIALAMLSLLFFSISKKIFELSVSSSEKLYFQAFDFPKYLDFLAKADSTTELSIDNAYSLETKPLLVTNYTAVSGDTYWMIAKRSGLSIDSIISFNKPEKAYQLSLGSKVKIPSINGLVIENIQNKDQLDALARRYNIRLNKLLFFNPNWQEENKVFIPHAHFLLSERMEILGGEFENPLQQLRRIRISSPFGFRIHPISKKRSFHKGIDLLAGIGTSVYAALGGRIIFSGVQSGYGNVIIILHSKGRFSKYAHLHELLVKAGQRVQKGQKIATVGNSGISTGAHLHFEIWKDGQAVNPRDITDFY